MQFFVQKIKTIKKETKKKKQEKKDLVPIEMQRRMRAFLKQLSLLQRGRQPFMYASDRELKQKKYSPSEKPDRRASEAEMRCEVGESANRREGGR